MSNLDWIIIGIYFLFSLAIGVYYSKRAGRSTSDFFLSGRNLPWWIAGLSMVATTFAADTPLAVTELVSNSGIAGNWLWWNMAIGGMLTVFFFARLWRRAGILTDVEFIELRYSGKPAAFLRGFRAVYLGLFMNCIILGWVNVAMGTILKGMFGISDTQVIWYLALAMGITAAYSALSGLWGVAVTDAFQFVIAMVGCIVLAVLVLNDPSVGGLAGLQEKLPASTFNIFPTIGTAGSIVQGTLGLSAGAFIAHIMIQWWASWYPGAEPGGGGYVAQRMMSAKDERHSVFAVLFFQVAHYVIRPWPWILVALATLVLYPELGADEKKLGYILAMNDYLPTGLKGLLVAAFFAAYMSTVATHLNWGTSYLVHDFWRRFIQPHKPEKTYVVLSRLFTILLMLVSLFITTLIITISGAWQFVIECGAGLGLVLIARWYWWRVNAWSEITATIVPIIIVAILYWINGNAPPENRIVFPTTLFIIVPVTTASWLIVTFLTRPVETETLHAFFRKIRPGGRMWSSVAAQCPDITVDSGFTRLFIDWLVGIVFVYSLLVFTGALFFDSVEGMLLPLLIACVSGFILVKHISSMSWNSHASPAE